jgi:uncharacterized repeat protein (TIGR02543 family)
VGVSNVETAAHNKGGRAIGSVHDSRRWYLLLVLVLGALGAVLGRALVSAQSGVVTSSAVPSATTPSVGGQIDVGINIDVSGVTPPDDELGSFTGSLDWDPAVLAYNTDSGILAGFTGVVNPSSGHMAFNGADPGGATGDFTVLTITFDVIGSGSSILDLEYSAMAAAVTFADLLPLLSVTDGEVNVSEADYTLTVNTVGDGSVTLDPPGGVYTAGTEVELTAEAAPGWEFSGWSGDLSGDANPETITMDDDKTVTAHFVDVTPPDTMITAHPDDPSLSADATFSFNSTEPGSTFECQLDGGGFTACTSPHTYTGLDYGDHTFEVRAIDGAGNPDPSPASFSWTINRVILLPLIIRSASG